MINVCALNAQCVSNFIQTIWNENLHSEISAFLHDNFIDHSMPYVFFQNQHGLLLYLKEMAMRVSHTTDILEVNEVDDFVFCKIRISAFHLSDNDTTRGEPEIIEGYRLFQMRESKIIAHWEMI